MSARLWQLTAGPSLRTKKLLCGRSFGWISGNFCHLSGLRGNWGHWHVPILRKQGKCNVTKYIRVLSDMVMILLNNKSQNLSSSLNK